MRWFWMAHKKVICHRDSYTPEEVEKIVEDVQFWATIDICGYIYKLKHALGDAESIVHNIEHEFIGKPQAKEREKLMKEGKLGALFG